ncbi:T9SS type A sorting domain-containing protein [Flavobacterium fluviale]|uniref:T9SS type A sorting domain-containing protein n=1 Tax=Flavobacterium fluviale TaxID=2249356 RepID=UPI001E3E85CA|nr:T9SS type A sorting domain-containing protein [Flavobacterium fluviale]
MPTDIDETEDNYYLLRRIATYQNIQRASNTLKIVIRTIRNNNTICCDQTLIISPTNTIDQPSLIIGSDATPESNGYLKYQWQSQSIDNNTGNISNWTNITGATSKDYLPVPLVLVSVYDSRTRGNIWTTLTSYNYRRITVPQYYNGKSSYSNVIKLSAESYLYSIPSVIAYPNPATSIINFENSKGDVFFKIETNTVSITNINGSVVNLNNYSILSPTKISVDVSSLPAGTYFANFDTGDRRSIKVTFIKSN